MSTSGTAATVLSARQTSLQPPAKVCQPAGQALRGWTQCRDVRRTDGQLVGRPTDRGHYRQEGPFLLAGEVQVCVRLGQDTGEIGLLDYGSGKVKAVRLTNRQLVQHAVDGTEIKLPAPVVLGCGDRLTHPVIRLAGTDPGRVDDRRQLAFWKPFQLPPALQQLYLGLEEQVIAEDNP